MHAVHATVFLGAGSLRAGALWGGKRGSLDPHGLWRNQTAKPRRKACHDRQRCSRIRSGSCIPNRENLKCLPQHHLLKAPFFWFWKLVWVFHGNRNELFGQPIIFRMFSLEITHLLPPSPAKPIFLFINLRLSPKHLHVVSDAQTSTQLPFTCPLHQTRNSFRGQDDPNSVLSQTAQKMTPVQYFPSAGL